MIKLGLIALTLTGSFSTYAQSPDLSPAPIIIADEVSTTLNLTPIQPLIAGGDTSNEISITHADAAFIKVHFSHFNIPEGAYITVSSPLGTESYQYDGVTSGYATFNGSNGENGINQFSAMSIFGDTVVIRLIMPSGVNWQSQHQVKIDKYNAGYSDNTIHKITQNTTSPESTCGENERRDVACWVSSNPVQYERTRPVARLLMAGSGLCTGWRVGNENHMFTNNHCLSTQGKLEDTEIWFNYQNTSCGGSTTAEIIKVTGKELLKTDYDLDYSLFSVNGFTSIEGFGNFGLETRAPNIDEIIYIAQHGAGNPKELSIESDQNAGGLCQIDIATTDGRGTNTDTGYFCDTTGGSSGSPVIAGSSNKVIALHHFGGCENQGVQINKIWPQVSGFFNDQPPQGDAGPDNGNTKPTAKALISCDELTCQFDGSQSTDSDGSIVAYTWNFGDDYSSSSSKTSHTYSTEGIYEVTLTVTDNDSENDSYSENITVSADATNRLQSGVPVSDLVASKGEELNYYIDTTENNNTVSVNTAGGSGDVDLYVKIGKKPTRQDYDCRPYENGNQETCIVSVTTPDSVHISLVAYSDFSGVELVADITKASDNGFPKTNLSAQQGDWLNYTYRVPTQVSQIEVTTSGGTGDVDLYVRKDSAPTTSDYDCRPYNSGNTERCTLAVTAGSNIYIGLRAYSFFSGVTLNLN